MIRGAGRTNPREVVFLIKFVITQMHRSKDKDAYSDAQLEGPTGIMKMALWMHKHVQYLLRTYASVFAPPIGYSDSANVPPTFDPADAPPKASAKLRPWWELARSCAEDPCLMYETLEGPKHKKNWLQSIPVEPARLLLKHIQDVYNCFFASEIKGALGQKGAGAKAYDSETFLAHDRVKRRFFTDFEAA